MSQAIACKHLPKQPYNGLHLMHIWDATWLALHDSLGGLHLTHACNLKLPAREMCLPSLPAAIHVDIRDLQQDLSHFVHVLICPRAVVGLP